MHLLAEPLQSQPATLGEVLALLIGYLELLAAAYHARDVGRPPQTNPLSRGGLQEIAYASP
jgi:hypothetical protein